MIMRGWFNTLKECVKAHTLKDDEFVNDKGEVCCKNCKDSRVMKIEHEGDKYSVGWWCECRRKAKEEQEERERKERRMEKVRNLTKSSLIGKRFEEASFASIDRMRPKDFLSALERCERFVANWDSIKTSGQGFYLYGDVGTGKTLLTACLGKALMSNLVPVMFTSFIEISKQLRDTYGHSRITETQLIDEICDIELLIIDDIGTERVKKDGADTFLQEKMFDIVNRRYENRKPTIFTSNYSLEALEERGVEERTIDRIAEMSAARIKLEGKSYRAHLSTTTKPLF